MIFNNEEATMSAYSFRLLAEIPSLLQSNVLMLFTKSVLFIKGILKLMLSGIKSSIYVFTVWKSFLCDNCLAEMILIYHLYMQNNY